MDGTIISVSIRVADWRKLPERIRQMVQDASDDSGIPQNGLLTVTMPQYRWDEIAQAMQKYPHTALTANAE